VTESRIVNCCDFAPVGLQRQTRACDRLDAPQSAAGQCRHRFEEGVRDFWTWIDKEPATIKLTGKAGIIYPSRGTAKVDLYPLAEV